MFSFAKMTIRYVWEREFKARQRWKVSKSFIIPINYIRARTKWTNEADFEFESNKRSCRFSDIALSIGLKNGQQIPKTSLDFLLVLGVSIESSNFSRSRPSDGPQHYFLLKFEDSEILKKKNSDRYLALDKSQQKAKNERPIAFFAATKKFLLTFLYGVIL